MKKINAEHGLGTGKGDIVCMCWLPDCIFYVEDKGKKELFEIFNRETTDDISGCIEMEKAFNKDLKGLSRRPRLESWSKALGIKKKPARPTYAISQEAIKNAELHSNPPPILIFPLTNVASRQYPIHYWVDISWKLKKRGENPIVITPDDDKRFGRCPKRITGMNFNNVAALMLKSKCVLGCDSLPAHMAGTLDVPTYVMGGPTGSNVYNHCPSVHVLQTPYMACVGCCFAAPYRAACDIGCSALSALFPDDVIDSLS